MPRLLTRNFALVTLAHLLQALGWSSMLLLPLYLDTLGADRHQIGAVMGSAAIGGLLLRPAVAWGLDVVGRKPTLAVGTLVMTLSFVLVAAIDDVSYVAYVVRVIFGVGVGALFSGYFTLAADIIPEARRTEGLALFGISGLVPLAINPISHHLGVNAHDLRWFLPLMGGVILLSLIPLAMIREPERAHTGQPLRLTEVVRALRQRSLWPCWLATFVFSGLAKLFMAFATVVAASRGIENPPDFWLTYAAGAVFVRLLGARLPDRLGPVRVVAPAIGLAVVAAVILPLAESEAGLLLAGLLAGIGHGYAFPILASLIVTRAPDHLRGSALTTFTALCEVSGLLLPPLLGIVADLTSDAVMFWVAAGFSALSLAAWVVMERRLPVTAT